MRGALEEAARGLGRTSPNPSVGCVVVQQGRVVGRGFHPKAGEPHAEVFALREAAGRARGATAYVTLEPCSHFGRTPPCADALIDAGVRRVVVAALDPNPQVAGRGVEKLRAAGIDVTVGPLAAEATAQQAGFRSLVTRARPWVVLKYAMTLDGTIATRSGDSRWVSSEAARALVHRWRDELDAVAVGAQTVLSDDPQLTTRGVPGGRDARRVVFDRRGRVPATARTLGPGSVLLTSARTDPRPHEAQGTTVVACEDPQEALRALGRLDIASVLLEGGPILAGALLEADLVDEVRVFVAPKLLGAGRSPLGGPLRDFMAQARELQAVRTETVGSDLLMCGLLHPVPTVAAPADAHAAGTV